MKSVTLKIARAGNAVFAFGAIVGVLLCVSLPLFSQGNFGRILGTVMDQTGGVISGATVSVIDKDRGVARTLTTDDAGEYNAPTLIPGTYTVRVEAKGFKTMERQNVLLEVGKEVRVDLTVQPGEQVQTVTVTEAVPLVETTNATLGGTLNNAQIQDLPLNGRNYQYLLSLRPGVMIQPGGGPWTQSTNNIRPDESAWMVDGVMNASFYDARPVTGASSFITDGATILPIDAIQEFNLEENPKAEYGWKPGAVVNVGIRSGTNNLHGTAYAFGRDQSFDARNIFNQAPDANGNCGQASCAKLPLQLEQFGGVVGGPIKKDKLFFFAGYEGMRSFIGNAFGTTVPATSFVGGANGTTNGMVDAILALQTAGVPVSAVSKSLFGCPSGTLTAASTCTGGLIQGASATSTNYISSFPNTNTSNNGIAKIDYRLNSKNMINGMLWIGRYTGVGEDHPMVNSAFDDTVQIPNWTTVVNWVWTPSSNVVNEARLGYTRNGQLLLPFDRNVFADGKSYALNTGVTNYGGFPTVTINGFGAQIGSWRGRPVENGPNPFYDFTDSVSYLRGKHAFKFGGEYAHIETDSAVHDTRGRIDFLGAATTLSAGGGCVDPQGPGFTKSTPLEDFFSGCSGQGTLLTGNAIRKMTWFDAAGFVQDDWRLTSKVIVNLGLRYSYTSPFHEANNLLATFDPTLGMIQVGQASLPNIWKPDYRDFSPRLGFAWDVSGKGTTVVRAGASIIYSSFAAASFVQQAGATNFGGGSIGAIPTGACVGASLATCHSAGGTIGLGTINFTGPQLTWNSVVFPGGGSIACTTSAKCNIAGGDPNLKTPYITNWNISVTRAFTNNLSLELGYVGNHGTRLTGFLDLNQPNIVTGIQPYATKFPYLNYINFYTNDGFSNYNSMQATLTKRVSHGLNFTAGYTYGHGLDNGSENRFGPLPQDSTNPRAEYASGDFDVRNRFTFTTGYEIPGKKGYGQLLEGWKVNSIVAVQSSQPWNIADSSNTFTKRGDKNVRWDFFGNPSDFKSGSSSIPFCSGFNAANLSDLSQVSCSEQSGISGLTTTLPTSLASQCTAVAPSAKTLATGGCYVDGGSVLAPPAPGTFGTMGRNIFRDNGFRNWDLSLFKNFTFKERFGAQFRFEVFDILNKATISNPNGANNGSHNGDNPSNHSAFGDGSQTPDFATGNPIIGSGGNRAIQLGLKLTF
jgi:Carboxypeptidase regulatory-like domain/TonB dependent receptor